MLKVSELNIQKLFDSIFKKKINQLLLTKYIISDFYLSQFLLKVQQYLSSKVLIVFYKLDYHLTVCYNIHIMETKKQKATELTNEVIHRIKLIFDEQEKRVEQMNKKKKHGGMISITQQNRFYTEINSVSSQIKTVLKRIKDCPKIKKQRETLYTEKLKIFTTVLDELHRKKNLNIKINNFLIDFLAKTAQKAKDTDRILRSYEKEASTFCGSIYNLKPVVERQLLELSQYGKFFENLSQLQSITNDSIDYIYLPIKFQENRFRDIQRQVIDLLPDEPKVPKEVPKPPQIKKDDHLLRQAHEMLFGFGRPQRVNEAIKIYFAQQQKRDCHPIVYNVLGTIYQQGKYLPKDSKKAFDYFLKSAKHNDAEGLYKVGQYLQKGYVYSKETFKGLYPNRQAEIRGGIQYYQRAAKLGHLDALTDLGYIYQKGIFSESGNGYYIEPHIDFAVKYYTLAKKQDFPRAYNNLGTLYISCNSLHQEIQGSNLQKGIKYLDHAVKLKYPKAFINLGKCYQNGVGVIPNIDKCRALYLHGAELGDIQCKLQYVKSHLGSQLDDEKTMIKLVQTTRQVLLVQKHNQQALYFMGLFFQKGIGVQANKQSSFKYIQDSAKLDYPPALTKLGDYYYSGYHVIKNIDLAKLYYEKAAKKNDTQALVNLGILIQKGFDQTENDPRRAQKYYQEAAKMGNTNALLLIGLLKDDRNNPQPNNYIKQAAQKGNIQAIKLINRQKTALVPKTVKVASNYDETLKKLSGFYFKKANNTVFR